MKIIIKCWHSSHQELDVIKSFLIWQGKKYTEIERTWDYMDTSKGKASFSITIDNNIFHSFVELYEYWSDQGLFLL
jgi:hypothetical protein